MISYQLRNENPKNRKTADCTIRALTTATGKPYLEVYKELFEISVKTGYMINTKQVEERFLEAHGFTKYKQPRKYDNTKYKVGEIDSLLFCENAVVVISLANHLTCVYHGTLYDLWDCRRKTISNYYVKYE